MIAIIYASRATEPLSDDALRAILEEARERNEARDVTGLLLAVGGSFLQILEGAEADVDAVYARIREDARHTELRLLGREEIEDRGFGGWWMGFARPGADDLAAALPGYKPSTVYPLVDPSLIHTAALARTLLEMYARNP